MGVLERCIHIWSSNQLLGGNLPDQLYHKHIHCIETRVGICIISNTHSPSIYSSESNSRRPWKLDDWQNKLSLVRVFLSLRNAIMYILKIACVLIQRLLWTTVTTYICFLTSGCLCEMNKTQNHLCDWCWEASTFHLGKIDLGNFIDALAMQGIVNILVSLMLMACSDCFYFGNTIS